MVRARVDLHGLCWDDRRMWAVIIQVVGGLCYVVLGYVLARHGNKRDVERMRAEVLAARRAEFEIQWHHDDVWAISNRGTGEAVALALGVVRGGFHLDPGGNRRTDPFEIGVPAPDGAPPIFVRLEHGEGMVVDLSWWDVGAKAQRSSLKVVPPPGP